MKTKTDSSYELYMPSQGSLNPPGEANIAIFADMDISPISLPLLERIEKWDQSSYDFILHNGDFAYNIQDENCKKGDNFLKK